MTNHIICVGHACVDLCHVHDHMPTLNNKSSATAVWHELGGCSARTALHLAGMNLPVTLVANLGRTDDPLTQLTLELMKPIPHLLISHVHSAAPVSHVWCDHHMNRTISSHQPRAVVDHVPLLPRFHHAQVAMMDSYRPLLNQAVLRQLPEQCCKILDWDLIQQQVDWQQLTGFDHIWMSQCTFDQLRMSLQDIADKTGAAVVGVTRGAQSVIWCQQGQVHQVDPPQVTSGVTLGAGDVFRAGLAAGIVQGMSMHQMITHACGVAVEYIQKSHGLTQHKTGTYTLINN